MHSPFSGLFTSTELRIIIIVEDLLLETIILDDCALKDLNQIFMPRSSWELLELQIIFSYCMPVPLLTEVGLPHTPHCWIIIQIIFMSLLNITMKITAKNLW